VIDILKNRELLADMSRNARTSARDYSIEAMVQNFAAGVLTALDTEVVPGRSAPAPYGTEARVSGK
jgi:hypothetical protein